MSLTGFLSYSRVNWQQSPSKSTPLNAANLNIMDAGIKNNNDMISNLRDEVTQLNSNLNKIPTVNSASRAILTDNSDYIVPVTFDISQFSNIFSISVTMLRGVSDSEFIEGYTVNMSDDRKTFTVRVLNRQAQRVLCEIMIGFLEVK